jgi:hypothetical protein
MSLVSYAQTQKNLETSSGMLKPTSSIQGQGSIINIQKSVLSSDTELSLNMVNKKPKMQSKSIHLKKS